MANSLKTFLLKINMSVGEAEGLFFKVKEMEIFFTTL